MSRRQRGPWSAGIGHAEQLLFCASLAAGLVFAVPDPASAQDTGLSKSELVRLVVSSTTPDEKVQTVSRRCLSFVPTEGDWSDLANLGASPELVAAAQECARAAQAVRIRLTATDITVRAGDSTGVTVTLSQAGDPLQGQTVTLSGSGGAGAGVRLSRTTDGRGRANFRLPAGTVLGAARYTVAASNTSLDGPTRITVRTAAAAPARAVPEPASLELDAGGDPPEVSVSVEDRFGNPVSGADLDLAAGSGTAPVIASATTDATGAASLTLADGAMPEEDATWELRSGDAVIATLPVRIRDAAPAPAAEVGVAGAAAAAGGDRPPGESAVDAAIRDGRDSLEDEDYVAAETLFRDALRQSPRRSDAQKGLAASLLAQNRIEEAITWYEVATRQAPEDADAWSGLGQAYAAAGRRDDAAAALARAQQIDPTREELTTEIADLGRPPGSATGAAWGGGTYDNAESGGIRRAEIDVRFSPALAARVGWDRSLAPHSPELVRGPDEWDSWFAGASFSYGTGGRLETALDFGQRSQGFGELAEGSELKQNVYRLTQTIRFSDDPSGSMIKIGGYLGRWFDRDDWVVFSRFKAPIGGDLSFLASGSYGETIGTNWVETGRHADKDGRVYAGVAWENEKGLALQPVIGVGRIDSERSDELTGTLLDLLLEGAVPVTRGADIRLFFRHQRPPGSEAFTVIALGFGLKVGWAGG
jgi:tetratricopeptide (TPR) repeat protein